MSIARRWRVITTTVVINEELYYKSSFKAGHSCSASCFAHFGIPSSARVQNLRADAPAPPSDEREGSRSLPGVLVVKLNAKRQVLG